MGSMRKLGYFLKEALIGFKRHFSTAFASIVTMFLSLLLIGAFMLVVIVLNNLVESVEDEINMSIWLSDDASDEDVNELMSYVSGLDGVADVSYISKEQALEIYKEENASQTELIEMLEEMEAEGINEMPASIEVELSDPQSVERIAYDIQANEIFQAICDDPEDPESSIRYGQDTVEKLFTFTNYVRYIGFALIALLVFIALVFINNTIRLSITARQREISIMRLVGASNGFIRGPFLTESILHALIGAGLSIGAIELVRRYLLPEVMSDLAWLSVDIPMSTYVNIYVILLVAGVIIALIGCAFAMRKYLKV